MAAVYANASLTIAASDANDSSEGFFCGRNEKSVASFVHPFREVSTDKVVFDYAPPNELDRPGTLSVLSRRGWVLQERLCSRRLLSFRKDRIVWECNQRRYSDISHHRLLLVPELHNTVPKRRIESFRKVPEREILAYWYDLLQTYSKCKLTISSDKLPALSGLAFQFSHVLEGTYVASTWSRDIHRGLTWTSAHFERGCEIGEGPAPCKGPSWSWVTQSCMVSTPDLGDHVKDFEVVSVDAHPRGIDPFGAVERGVLAVNGRIQKATLRKDPRAALDQFFSVEVDGDKILLAVMFDCHYSESWTKRTIDGGAFLYMLVTFVNESKKGWRALALEKVTDSREGEAFRRIGCMSCFALSPKLYMWLMASERQTIRII
jgi:hypothetical protein